MSKDELYRVTYEGGVTQELYRISQEEYNAFTAAKNSYAVDDSQENFQALAAFDELSKMWKAGKLFTANSPLGKALAAGDGKLILPTTQGGVKNIKFERL